MKILYAGFDGLGLDVFMMDRFPTFRWVRENGNWGRAVPKIRHTFPSWTCINTGLTIAVHGVNDTWQHRYREVPNKHKYIWDYAHDDLGLSCGVVTFPLTYPPRKWDDGSWFVSGYPAGVGGSLGSYYYPEDMRLPDGFYADWVDYVKETWSIPLGRKPAHQCPLLGEDTARRIIWFDRKKLELVRLQTAVDFLAVQIPSIDRIGHEMMSPEMRDEDKHAPLPVVWAWIDEALRWLIDTHKPDVILVASDHGMDVELHTWDGIWALVGPGVKRNARVNVDNWRVLPTFLDAVGVDAGGLSSSALVCDGSAVEDRLRALGYLE